MNQTCYTPNAEEYLAELRQDLEKAKSYSKSDPELAQIQRGLIAEIEKTIAEVEADKEAWNRRQVEELTTYTRDVDTTKFRPRTHP